MPRFGLRVAAFAIVGIGIPAFAFANGLVDDARQLFWADLTDAYEESVEYLEVYNTDDGELSMAVLRSHTEELAAATTQILYDAKALAPSLEQTWSSTQKATDALDSATEVVQGQVGVGEIRLDYLKSAYDVAGSELERSNAIMQDFGKRYIALMNGPVENAKALYEGAVRTAYDTTMQYLKAKNFKEGKPALQNLITVANSLGELSLEINDTAEELSPVLQDRWSGSNRTYYDINLLAIEAGALSAQVGKMAFSLDRLEAAYSATGYSLSKSYTEMKGFGDAFTALCDTCR
jgi:hypothetical protein